MSRVDQPLWIVWVVPASLAAVGVGANLYQEAGLGTVAGSNGLFLFVPVLAAIQLVAGLRLALRAARSGKRAVSGVVLFVTLPLAILGLWWVWLMVATVRAVG